MSAACGSDRRSFDSYQEKPLVTPGQRRRKNVLVPAAHSLGGIGVIRSLGRAGYRVHAVAPSRDALGLASRYADERAVHPPLSSEEFQGWFDDYVKRNDIALVMPGGGFDPDASFARKHEAVFPFNGGPQQGAIAASKFRLFERLSQHDGEAAAHLPPFLLVDLAAPLPTADELASLGVPLFIKLDGALGTTGASGDDVLRCPNGEAARAALQRLAADYSHALVQGYVAGRGVGAFTLRWDCRTVARMMHRRLHEMPHTGGASSLRQSWWMPEIMADAEAKLAAIGWQGVAMVEYRYDEASGEFWLMEINFRFWGSLHLSLYAGVDFPRLLADSFFGDVPAQLVEGDIGIRCRHLYPHELGYLVSLWRDRAVSWSRKAWSLVEAVGLTLDPGVRSDLLFPGDRRLFWRQLRRALTRRGG
ncbi:hypothetical protein WP12_10620 [Sphingomonas sp. SRS2]|nr:hypothetical protein WP12_10620 [Sphingomonas sp. SRS2]